MQLSQILGHSDQLYTKLPRGLRVWQYSNAIAVTGLAAAVSSNLPKAFFLNSVLSPHALVPSVWQPTALNLLFLSCVTDVSSVYMYLSSLYVERYVLTEIKMMMMMMIVINKKEFSNYTVSGKKVPLYFCP